MKRKISAAIIGMTLIFQSIPAFAAKTFTDLAENHWAYSVVNTLVEEGTINGYEDGSFKPANTVTRAEFIKMIGTASETKVEFSDVSPSHWAYNYISYTELAASYDNVFEPDRPITRGETLPVLWIRAGKPTVSDIPANITSQANGKNEEAVQWGYGYGIMVGNDGVNLRLNDTLTRAEAAALIIKARNHKAQINFDDASGIYEYVYNSSVLFDTPYEKNGTITNGELARAAVRLSSCEYTPTYATYYVRPVSFEHKYAYDLSAIAPLCSVGIENITAEFIDKPATVKDAESMMKLAFSKRVFKSINEDFNGSNNPSASVTKRQLVQMLMQFDKSVGMQVSSSTEIDSTGEYIRNNEHINTNRNTYPENYTDFSTIIEGVPTEVYAATLKGSAKPLDSFKFALDFTSMFAAKCKQLEEIALSVYGADIDITYYPSLTYDTGSSYAIRIKCTVNSVSKQVPATELFENVLYGNTNTLKAGDVFFAEVDFGTYAIYQ